MISTATKDQKEAESFLSFIDSSPSPYHAVHEAVSRLEAAGFTRLSEREQWDTQKVKQGGKYYVTRNQSSLVAFAVGGTYKAGNGFAIVGTHTDSCCFRVRPISKREKLGYLQVGVETYGGGLWHTWLDRDLGLAGRVIVNTSGKDSSSAAAAFETRLVRIDTPLLRIPTVAIHLDRTQNDAMKYNQETDMVPILALADKALNAPSQYMPPTVDGKVDDLSLAKHHQPQLLQHVAAAMTQTTSTDQIHDFELCAYDVQPASLGGANNEFVNGARFDNLFSTYCATEGLIRSCAGDSLSSSGTVRTIACWDHEEVGSVSAHGAQSNLLEAVMHRVSALHWDKTSGETVAAHSIVHTAIANSFLLSSDMGHAVHPSFESKHEINHRPQMNGGPIVKTNAKQRYASNAPTTFLLRRVAKEAGVPLQEYEVRNDMPCGSTIGPLVSQLGLRTVDIGCAQLSMHSIRETAGAQDVDYLIRLLRTFFERFEALDAALIVD